MQESSVESQESRVKNQDKKIAAGKSLAGHDFAILLCNLDS